MFKKILLVLTAIIGLLLIVAAFKSPDFRVQRSATLAAPPAALFEYVNNHRKFNEWNPFMKMDPAAKNVYTGPESGVGAMASWEGKATGKGSCTITESKPHELIRMKMDWLEPLEGTSTVEFTFVPQGDQTTVTWAMYGSNKFVGRLMSIFMDCDTMCGPPFEQGLADLGKLAAVH